MLGVFQAAIADPDDPGSDEVAQAFVDLVEMPAAERPLRTIVSSRIQPLLDPYNQTANALRTVVAQIFNVEESCAAARREGRCWLTAPAVSRPVRTSTRTWPSRRRNDRRRPPG